METGIQKSQLLQQIPCVPSCHSCGYMILSDRQRMESCWIGASSHSAVSNSNNHKFCCGIKAYIACHTEINLVCQILNPAEACCKTLNIKEKV